MRRLVAATVFFLGPGVADLGAQSVADAPVAAAGDGQYWYSGRQLRQPLVIELPGARGEACTGRTVSFDPGDDGQVSPALAAAEWDGERCLARAWWKLGPTIGIQHVRASVSGGTADTSLLFQAVARQGARVFFGGAWTPMESSSVELVESGTGPGELREVEGSGIFRPVVGVDFPIWPSWRRIRMAVGAGAREMDRHFYLGLSAMQGLVFGPGQESSSVDLHVGLQLSRRDVGISGARCAPDPVCTRRDLAFGGIMFLVAIDGASAFRGLAGAVLN